MGALGGGGGWVCVGGCGCVCVCVCLRRNVEEKRVSKGTCGENKNQVGRKGNRKEEGREGEKGN